MIDIYHLEMPNLENLDRESKEQILDIRCFAKISAVIKAIEQGYYVKVATVPGTSLENAFRLTNSVDSYWADNPALTIYEKKLRSTSVGDVMSLNGEVQLVSNIGFTQLPNDILEKLKSIQNTIQKVKIKKH